MNKISAGNLSAYAIRNTQINVTGEVSKNAVATLYDIQGRVILVKNMEEGLKTMQEVQSYFEKRVGKIVASKGKKLMGGMKYWKVALQKMPR